VPERSVDWSQGPQSAFFWPRKPNLDWTTALSLLSGWTWDRVHVHNTGRGLGLRGMTPEDRARFHVHETRWFEDRGDFDRELARSQVFLAPRRSEGIGISFLEAMALGMMVVAPDAPTMNEYLRSGVNGFLYDADRPVRPPWEDAAKLGKAARESVAEGRERWLREVPGMLGFFRNPGVIRERGRMVPASIAAARRARTRYREAQLWKSLVWAKRTIFAPLRMGR
jgi:glycosyltransferase involved in cell wall biosynthesis